MLRRYILYTVGFVLLMICAFRCEVITGPNFPDTPKISFREIRKFRITDRLGNANDSISIAIKFQDGDGDLGMAAGEIGQPPYQREIPDPNGSGDTIPNPRYFNYHVKAERLVNGEWVEEVFTPTLSGQYPLLNEGKKGPIEGTLYYGIRFPLTPTSPANIIYRFDVFIYDRAGNRSDPITTSEVIINEK